jgi:pimeloyl-ACP methyl ester carboxylesterase
MEGPVPEDLAHFTSPVAQERFLAGYDALRDDLLPADRIERTVDTAFGPTFTVSLPGTGTPVVFLHGHTGNAVSWYEFLAALAGGPPVHALDTIGELGRSVQTAPVGGPDRYAAWLGEVLDGLGAERAHLVGISQGGWLALNQAVHDPDRVASLTLGEPAGVMPLTMGRFMARSAGVAAAALLPGFVGRPLAAVLHTGIRRMPRQLLSLSFQGMRSFRGSVPNPPLLADDELRSITQPAYVLLASNSECWTASAVQARLAALVPHAQVEIAPKAAHGVGYDRPGLMLAGLDGLRRRAAA